MDKKCEVTDLHPKYCENVRGRLKAPIAALVAQLIRRMEEEGIIGGVVWFDESINDSDEMVTDDAYHENRLLMQTLMHRSGDRIGGAPTEIIFIPEGEDDEDDRSS
jgi:hypothetical protein